jgi:hypothetical protein
MMSRAPLFYVGRPPLSLANAKWGGFFIIIILLMTAAVSLAHTVATTTRQRPYSPLGQQMMTAAGGGRIINIYIYHGIIMFIKYKMEIILKEL